MSSGNIIKDIHDPGKQGMFSKAGRYTSEKYMIFSRKDEILYGKKKYLKVSQFQHNPDNKESQKLMQDIQKKEQKIEQQKKTKSEESQPFFKQISREKRALLVGAGDKELRKGNRPQYQISYSEIDKSPHLVWNVLKVYNNRTQPRQTYTPVDTTQEELYRPIPEKVSYNSSQGYIAFKDYTDRTHQPGFIAKQNNPHEKRFYNLSLPQTWSNMRKTQTFNLAKTVGRDDNKGYSTKEHQPDYAPNWKFGKKDFSKSVVTMQKVQPRKPMWKVSQTQNEKFFDYDRYTKTNKSMIFKNNQSQPLFEKQLPREIDPSSPLPSFMQKHVNMRSTLQSLHHKMLENNYFSGGRFQSTTSDFAKSAQFFRKSKQQNEDEEDEEEDDEESVYQND